MSAERALMANFSPDCHSGRTFAERVGQWCYELLPRETLGEIH